MQKNGTVRVVPLHMWCGVLFRLHGTLAKIALPAASQGAALASQILARISEWVSESGPVPERVVSSYTLLDTYHNYIYERIHDSAF